MAASKIVAERLTITGSIGVITGKFSLEELYGKVGYAKELISKGRCVYTSSRWKSSPTLPCKMVLQGLNNTQVGLIGRRGATAPFSSHESTAKCGPYCTWYGSCSSEG